MNTENIEQILKELGNKSTPPDVHKIAENLSDEFTNSLKSTRHILWRNIMNYKLTKLTAAACVIFAIVFGVTVLDKSVTPAWGIEQTVEAMEQFQTLVISGDDYWGSESIPFKFWIKFSEDDKYSFDMRYESENQIIVIRGIKAWAYWHDENTVKVYENIKDSKGMMRDIQFWYKIAQLNPWFTGKMLSTLKLFADDWQETYGKDEQTGEDCVYVTCSYKPLSCSFDFVCNRESKLITEGKYWRNVDRRGPPVCHASSFTYNEEISDEVFEFEFPEGATVIDRKEEEEADALFNEAEELFHNKKEYKQAINIYQKVYEKYSHLNKGEEALSMIGICYDCMGQYEKAIATYKKAIKEYPDLRGWIESTYFYLGLAYMQTNQKEKALEAFQNCLILGQGIREPDKFPLKHAREYIEKLKNPK